MKGGTQPPPNRGGFFYFRRTPMEIGGLVLFAIIVGAGVYWMKKHGKGPFK